jgi:hypothetical protein
VLCQNPRVARGSVQGTFNRVGRGRPTRIGESGNPLQSRAFDHGWVALAIESGGTEATDEQHTIAGPIDVDLGATGCASAFKGACVVCPTPHLSRGVLATNVRYTFLHLRTDLGRSTTILTVQCVGFLGGLLGILASDFGRSDGASTSRTSSCFRFSRCVIPALLNLL